MSKFIDNLEAKLHHYGDKPIRPSLPELTAEVSSAVLPWELLREYTILVRYEVKQHCKPEELPAVLKTVKHKLQEEIFGEFRQKLIELQRNIYGDNRQESLEILRQIFEEIER